LCVPDVDGLRVRIFSKAHKSRYKTHLGTNKMYHELKEIYWWNNMKRDMAHFVAKCMAYQQMKVQYLRPSGMSQKIELPMWRREMINMDSFMGISRSRNQYDLIWVTVDFSVSCLFICLLLRTNYS